MADRDGGMLNPSFLFDGEFTQVATCVLLAKVVPIPLTLFHAL